MVVGAIGPWVTALGASASGIDGSNDGWIVLAAAVGASVTAYAARARFACGWFLVAGGLTGAATAGYDRHHLQAVINAGGALGRAFAHVGWGLNLDLFASLSLLAAGL